jgi:hypothetical protein
MSASNSPIDFKELMRCRVDDDIYANVCYFSSSFISEVPDSPLVPFLESLKKFY